MHWQEHALALKFINELNVVTSSLCGPFTLFAPDTTELRGWTQ